MSDIIYINRQYPFKHAAIAVHVDTLHIGFQRFGQNISNIIDHSYPVAANHFNRTKKLRIDILGPGYIYYTVTIRLDQMADILAVGAMHLYISCTANKTDHIIARNGITAVGIAVPDIRNLVTDN